MFVRTLEKLSIIAQILQSAIHSYMSQLTSIAHIWQFHVYIILIDCYQRSNVKTYAYQEKFVADMPAKPERKALV